MIDKLELLVPVDVPKRHGVWQKQLVKPARFDSPYAHTLDADFQLSLRVHYNHRVPVPREKQHFKVDFTNTRLLSDVDLLGRLSSLFDIGSERARALKIARIDLTADVFGVPIEWFKRHCRVKGKRNSQMYEGSASNTSKGSVTSVVFGKRPDLYRIYDRIAEKRSRHAEVLYAGMHSGAPPPILTRVERQCSGRAIPNELSTLGALFKHGADIDPFPRLLCGQPDMMPVADNDWTPQKWLMNIGLAAAVREFGEAAVRARLNRAGGNAKRTFEKYSEMLRSDSPGVTAERLRQLYRNSTIKQLNIPVQSPGGETSYPRGSLSYTL